MQFMLLELKLLKVLLTAILYEAVIREIRFHKEAEGRAENRKYKT